MITGGIITLDDALARIGRRASVAEVEHVTLDEGLGRVLAEDIVAAAAMPGHDCAAMDGYAFRFADIAGGSRLRIAGRAAAGHPLQTPLSPGCAVRIFTGAAMPDGADTVAMQEYCHVHTDHVVLPRDITMGANRRKAGEDVSADTVVLRAGTRLRPQDIGMAAAVGRPTLAVRRRITAVVIATGDELRAPGQPLPPGCIYNSNRHSLVAALRGLGAHVHDLGVVRDRKDEIRQALLTAADLGDMIISTGGISVGEEDHVRSAVLEIGSLDFWKLPIKPGRPVAVGTVGAAAFVGLPGNPVSAMVTYWLIGRAIALHLMGAIPTPPQRFPVPALFDLRRKTGRREFLRARLCREKQVGLGAQIYRSASSGMLSSLSWSDGLVEIPEDVGDVARGDTVLYLPYYGLDG